MHYFFVLQYVTPEIATYQPPLHCLVPQTTESMRNQLVVNKIKGYEKKEKKNTVGWLGQRCKTPRAPVKPPVVKSRLYPLKY